MAKNLEPSVELGFTSLNPYGETLEYISGDSPTELRDMIRSLRHETQILAIYAYGSKHIAWISTRAKIKRKVK